MMKLSWIHILAGYESGIFPMGEGEETLWYSADPRAIIPLDSEIKLPRSLKQQMSKGEYQFTHNKCFNDVIERCSEREPTWINNEVKSAFIELHRKGYGHSIEAWHNGALAGGLYGVAYHGAFFGESMFHSRSNASKICVIKLIETLQKCGFLLLDIQIMTPHFKKLGAVDIDQLKYLKVLSNAMAVERQFIFD